MRTVRLSRSRIAVAAAVLAWISPSSTAQTATAYRGEPVVSASGEVVAPWIEKRGCEKDTPTCVVLVVNPNTNEIALIGDRLSSRFELTGNGREIRRAESTLDKARRLSTEPR